jgi:hypothetical protein
MARRISPLVRLMKAVFLRYRRDVCNGQRQNEGHKKEGAP